MMQGDGATSLPGDALHAPAETAGPADVTAPDDCMGSAAL